MWHRPRSICQRLRFDLRLLALYKYLIDTDTDTDMGDHPNWVAFMWWWLNPIKLAYNPSHPVISTRVKSHSEITNSNRWVFCGPSPHAQSAKYPLANPQVCWSADYRWPEVWNSDIGLLYYTYIAIFLSDSCKTNCVYRSNGNLQWDKTLRRSTSSILWNHSNSKINHFALHKMQITELYSL